MAWNPGARTGLDGDTHWWVQWFWTDSDYLDNFKVHDDVTEFEFYNPGNQCDCNHEVLQLRTAGHINPPPPGSYSVSITPGACGAVDRDAVLEMKWINTAFAALNTPYDVSVDAEMLAEDLGEVNLTWEVDSTGPNWCDVWLAKVEYCADNHLHGSDPTSICCSDRAPGQCNWQPCGE